MNQYYPDPKLKRKLERTQYKKHPKWAKRKWVRRILFIIGPIVGVMFYLNISKQKPLIELDQDIVDTMDVVTGFAMGAFALIPCMVYWKVLEGSCLGQSRDR